MILGSASWSHMRGKLLNKGENLLGSSPPSLLPPLGLQALLECMNHRRCQAFPCKMRKFRSQGIRFRVLEIETLQNSTLDG
jgi:hypothetical protein